MKTTICLASILVLACGAPHAAAAQDKGRGNDERGSQKNEGGGRGNDDNRGGGQERNDNRGRGGDDDRGNGRGNDDNRGGQQRASQERRDDNRDNRGRGDRDDFDQRVTRGVRVLTDDDRRTVLIRLPPERGLIAGCPPGLARKDNGCLPPGQARRIARARYDYLWDRRDDNFDYRYDDGYLYRLSPQGSLLGYLPVLGGALGLGNPWPAQYAYEPAPAYYADYYRLNDRYDYRYADGVLYGLDPQTQSIGQVAALLTGQQWNVGRPMPTGYDVYNVPYAYRDQYADGPDRMYRYNDGYVYQVDPTTQLVQAVIQLLV